MAGRARRRGRRTAAVAITVTALLVGGAATAAATGIGLPNGDDDGGQSHSDLPPATAQVTKRTLSDTVTEDGDLGYGDATTLSGRLSGTVTKLPVSGNTLSRGKAAYRVDDQPVVLMYGSLPAYRALSSGTEGKDVKQFESNLKALGYKGFTVDNKYSDATADAVKQWQEDLGLEETGTVELGRVEYVPGAIRVDAVSATLGATVGPGAEVLTYTGTTRVITVELDLEDQELARKGAAVSITLPNDRTVPGKISKTETVIKPAEGQQAAATVIDVTVTVDDAKSLSGLDQATVDVRFTSSQRENVLAVPVTALLALAEGGYGVQVVEGTSTRILAVRTGLFANGWVEVSGDGLAEGMTVGVPA